MATGNQIGATGFVHDPDLEATALHFSVRIDGVYVNPAFLMSCFSHQPSDALCLLPADD